MLDTPAVKTRHQRMIYFLASSQLCGIEPYLRRYRQSSYPEIEILAFEDVFSRRTLPSGTWVFMGARQLPPAGKRLADLVWRALYDADEKVLNRPKSLLTRHELLEAMFRAGINDFRSYRPSDINADIRYPVFVREAEPHTGSISGLLHDRRQLESFLRWQRLRGYKSDELLVIKFCDTADEHNEYRKYSAQYVQGQVTAQYLHVDQNWMVKHHGKTYRDEWAHQEFEFVKENARAEEIRKIFQMAKVDFGRLDYGLLDGKLQVWEINTNPSIGGAPLQSNVARTPERIRKLQDPGKKIFYQRFHSMLESIDTPHEPDMTIELRLRDTDLEEWRNEVRARNRLQRRRDALRSMSDWTPIGRVRDLAKHVLGVRDQEQR